jgi:hypothetical protein
MTRPVGPDDATWSNDAGRARATEGRSSPTIIQTNLTKDREEELVQALQA